MSDLLARLRIEASAGGLPAVAGAVKNELGGIGTAAQRAGGGMASASGSANKLAGSLDHAGDQAQRFEGRTKGAASASHLLSTALSGAAVGAFVTDITRATFAAGGLQLGLGAVAGGAANAQGELAFVRTEATRLGLVAQNTSKDFLDLAASTNGTAIAGAATREIWLATAEAGMALGRAPEQIGRGLTALSQIAGKGVVSMEEVRQQLAEAIPGAAVIGARAMGLTSAEFNKLVESGNLTADVFLPKFAAQLRKEFGPAIEAYLNTPLGQARQNLGAFQTDLNDLKADAGAGFLQGMNDGLARLNEQLSDDSTATQAREIGEALGQGAAFAADMLVVVIDNLDELVLAAQVVAGVGLARYLVSTAAAAQQAAAAFIVKAGAARTAALTTEQALAGEAAALTGIRGAIISVAQAEIAAAVAAGEAAAARELGAKAAVDAARADLANASSSLTLAQRRQAVAVAEAELTVARNASTAAVGRVMAAEAGHARSLTALGQVGGAAKGALGGLLAMVGGPWGAAFLAAGGAVWYLVNAHNAEVAAVKEVTDWVEDANAAHERAVAAAAALGRESASLVTTEESAAVAAASLTGEVDKLAEAHYRAAAAAKAHALELAVALMLEAKEKTTDAQAQFTTRRRINAQTETMVSTPYGTTAAIGINSTEGGDARSLQSQEYRNLTGATAELIRRTATVTDIVNRPLDAFVPEAVAPNTGGGSSGGRNRRDKAADLVEDLSREEKALASHALAALEGEAALDRWRIAQAGVDAVARADLESGTAAAETIRKQAEAVERLAIADERIERAASFTRSANADTEALQRRAAAAMLGRAALEELRVSEASLDVLRQAGVERLDQLNELERGAVQQAMAAAEAKERQALATEKVEAASKSVEQLTEEIAAEERRQAAVGRGIAAEVEYARAEFIRQEVERAGLKVTDEAARAIIEKADALFRLQAVTEGQEAAADFDRELRMLRLSNRERDIAVRAETILTRLLRERADLSADEAKAVAERRARAELEAEETAAAIGRITGSLRDGFIKDGKLGLEEIGDFAEERLRAAVYDAFLAEPINIMVKATVDIVNDLAKQLFSGGGQGGGFLQSLFGGGQGGGLGGMMQGGGPLAGIGQAAGMAGAMYAMGQLSSSLAGSITGALGGNAKKASQWGWLGTVPGLIAGLTDKPDRPYARADVEVVDGKFVLKGTQTADGGDGAAMSAAGAALAKQLNELAKVFGLDLKKVENLYTTIGRTDGGNAKALGGDGFFGGMINGLNGLDGARDIKGWTLGAGVKFSQGQDAEAITEQIIRDTILRAINAGASDLSEAERRFVAAAESLDQAIEYIQTSRNFAASIDDMLLQLTDPAAFEKKKALAAIEETYASLKAEAEKMIGAGLVSADVLAKIEEWRRLQTEATLNDLSGGNPFFAVRDRLKDWLDGMATSDVAPGGVRVQRNEALEQYQRQLALARGGDANALASLTSYADRLLQLDRQATGSASDRASLFNQVMGDVRALVGIGDAAEPLTPANISGPIIAALSTSQTATAAVLTSLPADIAAPLLTAILQEPDWATRLLGENTQVPPALQRLADEVGSRTPAAAASIVEAVLETPGWSVAMNARLATVTPSVDAVREAISGLPASVTGPIVDALAQQPVWASALVAAVGDQLGGALKDLARLLRRLLGLPDTSDPRPEVLPGGYGPDNDNEPGTGGGAGGGTGGGSSGGGGVGTDQPTNPWQADYERLTRGVDMLASVALAGDKVTPLTVPGLSDLGGRGRAGDDAVVGAIESLGRVFNDRLTDLRRSLEGRIDDLTDATVESLEGLGATSEGQLEALKDLSSTQRVTAAHAKAKAA